MKTFFFTMLCALWIAQASAADEPLLGKNLAGLLDYARVHNPEFAAAHYDADAAQQRVQSASALPDPVLRTELMDITNQGTNKGTSLLPSQVGSTRYTLLQSFPWFGKRDLQREVAEAQVAQTDGQVTATWADLSSSIKSVYAQYYYWSGSERLARETLDLLNSPGASRTDALCQRAWSTAGSDTRSSRANRLARRVDRSG